MKRLVLVFALFAIVACTGDTAFPTPTGKGTIRAINAIPASPSVEFRIEQRLLGTLGHRDTSTAMRFDDFDYLFSFMVFIFGDTEVTTIASETLKVDVGIDYTFVLSGDLNAPDVTIWQGNERDFSGTETVFEVRFGHTAATADPVDVYFAADGVAPVVGEEIGTLSFGEVLPAIDVEEGAYVLTVTTAGAPLDVQYQSAPTTFVAESALIISIFDPDGQDTGNLVTRIINSGGVASPLPDSSALPTIRFIQASQDLANADVYDDEMVSNLVLNDHAYMEFSDDIEFPAATIPLSYTTVGDTSAILFESGISTVAGFHFNFIVIGREGERFGQTIVPDRRSISTFAKIRPYHAAFNNDVVDIYIVDSGLSIDEESPLFINATYSITLPSLAVAEGSYDMYVTLPGEKTIVGGPLAISVVLGDVVEILFFDAVNPAVVDMQIIPPSP